MEKEKNNNDNKDENSSCENCHKEHSASTKSEKKSEFNTQNALITVVAVLVIMSGVQVFQTQKLLGAVSDGAVNAGAQTQGNSIGLPSQVGGCE